MGMGGVSDWRQNDDMARTLEVGAKPTGSNVKVLPRRLVVQGLVILRVRGGHRPCVSGQRLSPHCDHHLHRRDRERCTLALGGQ